MLDSVEVPEEVYKLLSEIKNPEHLTATARRLSAENPEFAKWYKKPGSDVKFSKIVYGHALMIRPLSVIQEAPTNVADLSAEELLEDLVEPAPIEKPVVKSKARSRKAERSEPEVKSERKVKTATGREFPDQRSEDEVDDSDEIE